MATRNDNNFTFLRFLAASMVIVAHSYDLQGSELIQDPLAHISGYSLGWAGVSIFFVMSGYLIGSSLERSTDFRRFFLSRALRVFPGLLVCIVLSILVLSLVSTFDFNTYIRSQETLAYLIGNGSLLSIHYNLPGVFASNPYPRAVNGSLWTLPFEIGCYIMAATIYGIGMLAGAKYRSWLLYLAFAISILLALSAPQLTGFRGAGRVTAFAQLAFCFLIGMIFVRTGMSGLRWWHGPALGAVAWLFSATVAYDVIFRVAIAIGALWLAFVPSKLLRRLSAAPDYSFGIYIYAFPIQQLLISQAPSLAPPAHAVFAFLLILIPAALSWHFVEKPALRLKPKGPVAIEMNQYEKNAEEVEATPDLNPLKQRDFCDG